MAPIILVVVIVFFPLIIGGFISYYGYQQYKRRGFQAHDEEHTRHLEDHPRHQQSMRIRDISRPESQSHSNQWYGSPLVVPTSVAPVAKPPPASPYIEYTGGGGLVSAPERVFLTTDEGEEGIKRGSQSPGYFQKQILYSGPPWDWEKSGYPNAVREQPDVVPPRPVRAVTRPMAQSSSTVYDLERTAASEILKWINEGELHLSKRQPQRKVLEQVAVKAQEILPDPRDFNENIMKDVDLDRNTKEWPTAKRSATPIAKRSVKRGSLDSLATVADANNSLLNLPLSYLERKLNLEPKLVKPAVQGVDRAAEVRRKMEEAKKQRAARQRQEEEGKRRSCWTSKNGPLRHLRLVAY
ncbi:hypothetical protein TW65_00671 [Stemphylium lycopersici]|nr:hypothetical protein TW65_00671 [Stemphylium lycopersici]